MAMKKLAQLAVALLIFTNISFGQANIPSMKVAVIQTDNFFDLQKGLTVFTNAFKQLNREFEPKENELRVLQSKLDVLNKEKSQMIQMGVATLPQLQAKEADIERAAKEYKNTQANTQNAYDKRKNELFQVHQQSVAAALQEFSQKNGFNLLIDVSKAQQGISGSINVNSIDVTAAFINDYNLFAPNQLRQYSLVKIPLTKAVFVVPNSFYDEKIGINKMIAVSKQLLQEFQTTNESIKKLQDEINRLSAEYKNLSERGSVTPSQLQTKKTEIDGKQRIVNDLTMAARQNYEKRRDFLSAPIEKIVLAEFTKFNQQNGVEMVLDAAVVEKAILYYTQPTVPNITADFAKYFNAKIN